MEPLRPDTDKQFLEDLRASYESVMVAARWLSGKKYPVVVQPTFERPEAKQASIYADNGDLAILQRVEVKHRRSVHFTSKEDFPYPTVIVDVCHSFDNANPKPFVYIILNAAMDGALIVDPSRTRHRWTKSEKHDRFKGRERSFYECPVELTWFEKMPPKEGAT